MRHLLRMASYSSQTNMHARNLAIVWAPNLLRSKDIESSGFNGTAAFMEVRVQSIVVEFILTHVEQVFGDWINYGKENEESTFASVNWPTCVPEDYYRSLSYNLPNMLNHGDGPPQIRPYHTIIEFSDHKRKGSLKAKKWKSIFNLGRSNPESKRKSQKQDDKDGKSGKMSLRPAKSMDSLSSVPHATHGSDLGQNGVALRSPKNQLSLRRESFGSPSNEENVEFTFLDSGEQLSSMDTNDAECEEEGQAKSEPTTPKPGRSAITGKPPGRSPKSNQSRAEKCVGVHISGPFSVTLPFHITSNLSRLTRGMECPGLSIMVPQRSSENIFSLEGNLSAESDDTDKVTLRQMAEKENAAEEAGKENTRISLEVQDSFSFLDVQDTSIEKTPENTVDSEMLGYELQAENKMEEFSVEPPPDDLCTEDEAEQMYFMPSGFVDEKGHWRQMHESLEDIYLSAHDDLSPITQAPEMNLENKELCIFHETLPTNTDRVDGSFKEDQPRFQDVAYSKEDPHLLTGTETPSNEIHNMLMNDHHSQHCNSDDGATEEVCREEAEHVELCSLITDLQEDTTPIDLGSRHESEHIDLCASINDLQEDTTLVDPDSREESEHIAPCTLSNDLQAEKRLVDPGSREGQNMDLLNAENRSGKPAHEGIQHKRLGQHDMEIVKGKELLDCSGPPTHNIAENNMDCTVDLHHVCHMEDEGILEASVIFQQPHVQKLNIKLSKATLENCDCEDEDSGERNPDQHDGGDASANTSDRSTSDKSMSSITPSLTHVKTSKRQNHCTERRPAEDLESIIDNQCYSDDDPHSCLCSSAEEAMGDNPRCDQMGNPEEKMKDFLQQKETVHVKTNEDTEAYPIGQRLPHVSKSPAELDGIVPQRKHPTGSVAMKLMATTNKIQQAKSVPVVPPKPQFTKLPPALKSKIQVSSSSSAKRDTRSQKMEKSNHLDTSETSTDSAPKRRSSWRNATSVSFDTAMALAKERQCQNPVRRMQTYCIGDSYEVMDTTKSDNAPQAPRFTVKSASSRAHRPFSFMPLSYGDGELHGPVTVEKETMHGLHPIFNHEPEPYTKEVPHRNRLSMPRLGQPSLGDEQAKCHKHQRRSLL
ncbi:rho GTPase-activating protein 30 isoform X2 [Bufo bufo]|nr:rho GTPase-activating protein 30 isoform X2 [Bufo bufo]